MIVCTAQAATRPEKETIQKKRTDIKTLPYLSRLKRKFFQRDDEWTHQVYGRISTCVGLVFPDDKYHRSCMQVFHIGRAIPVIYWMMSAKGFIGCIMAGSGLEEMFETVYAPRTVPQMMSGLAYTRVFCGHLLAACALLSIRLQHDDIKLDDHQDVLTDLMAGAEKPPESNSSFFQSVLNIISTVMTANVSDSKTMRLWESYLCMTQLLRLFMLAERTGHFVYISCNRPYCLC